MMLKFVERVKELIEMEKITDCTCDPDFMGYYNKLMGTRDHFVNALAKGSGSMTIEVVNDELEVEIMNEVMVPGGGIEKMLNELPLVAKKRVRLQSIGLLQESKEVIEQ
ncbi:hypothetical protein Tco_0549623, partial [Tanacetum coccineum]